MRNFRKPKSKNSQQHFTTLVVNTTTTVKISSNKFPFSITLTMRMWAGQKRARQCKRRCNRGTVSRWNKMAEPI